MTCVSRRAFLLATAGAPLVLPAWLAGCAAPDRGPVAGARWSGRLALQVEGDAQRSFSAGFDLRGSAQEGELELTTPLGGMAALLQWAPGSASLWTPGQPTRSAASLDELVTQAAGAPLPVAALFDWLGGIATAAEGWQADLSQRPQGRLRARKLSAPAADLRLVLELP